MTNLTWPLRGHLYSLLTSWPICSIELCQRGNGDNGSLDEKRSHYLRKLFSYNNRFFSVTKILVDDHKVKNARFDDIRFSWTKTVMLLRKQICLTTKHYICRCFRDLDLFASFIMCVTHSYVVWSCMHKRRLFILSIGEVWRFLHCVT